MNIRFKISFLLVFLCLTASFFQSCGIEPLLPPNIIKAPFNLVLYPHNGSITVQFESYNNEENFDGFNVYLSQSSGIRTSGIEPLKPNGTLPTIPATRYETSGGKVIRWTFSKDASNDPLLNGVTYYVSVRSRSYDGFLSDFTAEVSTTPRPESSSVLFLANGSGFSLVNNNFSEPYDIKLTRQSNVSFLSCPSGRIKDEGYYYSMEEYNRVVDDGFLPVGASVPVAQGHVYIIKRTDNRFGKIYVKSVDDTGINFEWAFQEVVGNLDI